jgi:molybdate transport system ATP-binding protein
VEQVFVVRDRRLSVALRQPGPIPLDVEFTCDPGQVLAIFGPSGSGKTTILRTIAGLYQPAQATVQSATETWTDTSTRTFQPPHRRAVGFVFQEYALFPHLSAVGNVMTALGHVPRGERRTRAEHFLELVHLSGHMSRRPRQLSGGERQRVALARALAREPAVLLLDEPFAAVDRLVRRRLQDEIDGLRQKLDMPLILVTHDFDDVVRLATHVLLLESGRSVAWGPVSTLMSRPDLTWLRDAVGLGSVFDAEVARTLSARGLLELSFKGGTLLTPLRDVGTGTKVRVRIPAREVILASHPPQGLSLHNMLAGTVSAIHAEQAFDQVMVQVAIGDIRLLAEVTSDAVARLGLAAGVQVYALIKSVSIDVIAPRTNGNNLNRFESI